MAKVPGGSPRPADRRPDRSPGPPVSPLPAKAQPMNAFHSPATVEDFGETALSRFRAALEGPNLLLRLRNGLIGDGQPFAGPYGPRRILYADYVASGRALFQVEDFVTRHVLPFYGNSHTEASYCGAYVTRMREEARETIRRLIGGNARDHAVIFAGSGATAGLNRLVSLFSLKDILAEGRPVTVFTGPYEHHSNILPWRESGARVVEVPEADTGGPDLAILESLLQEAGSDGLCIGAFSAASNVTGILTDMIPVTRLLRRYGARAVWDCAGSGPYLPIDLCPEEGAEIDAVVVSPHKFVGGPAASGILAVRRDAVTATKPTWPGGGSVSFVSPWEERYSSSLESREEAGTPNVIGDIRAALAFLVKDTVSAEFMAARHAELRARALTVWGRNPRLRILGNPEAPSLPIFSFQVRDEDGGLVHHQLFTRILSDLHGVQVRGGCACAGPYAHRLLDIDAPHSTALMDQLREGQEMARPGWVRLNFTWLTSDQKADEIIRAVDSLSHEVARLAPAYRGDTSTARFRHAAGAAPAIDPIGA